MQFGPRELTAFAEPISATELEEGSIYFFVNYIDAGMLIPTMETVVFIGRDLEPGDSSQVYFQDIESYQRGVRYEKATNDDHARFSAGSENEVGHIFDYEHALDELMRCSTRRARERAR